MDDLITPILKGLHPSLLAKVTIILERMGAAGHPMKVIQGVRTADQQHLLYMQGRPGGTPGKVVTNCDGEIKKSRHQLAEDGLGHAVDICFQGNDPFGIKQPWKLYGETVKSCGLVWGGDFHLVDLDHAELV